MPDSKPKSSMPISVQAIGVWVAPENTATNPIPANKAIGNGIKTDKALPRVAPMKNKGVTSPPLKPEPKVNPLKSIFNNMSYSVTVLLYAVAAHWLHNDRSLRSPQVLSIRHALDLYWS